MCIGDKPKKNFILWLGVYTQEYYFKNKNSCSKLLLHIYLIFPFLQHTSRVGSRVMAYILWWFVKKNRIFSFDIFQIFANCWANSKVSVNHSDVCALVQIWCNIFCIYCNVTQEGIAVASIHFHQFHFKVLLIPSNQACHWMSWMTFSKPFKQWIYAMESIQ